MLSLSSRQLPGLQAWDHRRLSIQSPNHTATTQGVTLNQSAPKKPITTAWARCPHPSRSRTFTACSDSDVVLSHQDLHCHPSRLASVFAPDARLGSAAAEAAADFARTRRRRGPALPGRPAY